MKLCLSIFFYFSVIGLIACQPAKIDVEISFAAKDQENQAVTGAEVFLDNHSVGKTDRKGNWHGRYLATVNSSLVIKSSKSDDLHYYGSYYHQVAIRESMGRSIKLIAKMAKIARNMTPQTNARIDASQPVEVVDSPMVNSPSEENSTVSALGLLYGNAEITEDRNNEPPSLSPSPDVLTVYAFASGRPLANVEIRLNQNDQADLNCVTSVNGRCVVKSQQPWPNSNVKLAAIHPGMQTQILSSRVDESRLLQLEFKYGNSLNIRAVEERFGRPQGIDGVNVLVNGVKVGETSGGGYYAYFQDGADNELGQISLEHPDLLPQKRLMGTTLSKGWNILRFAPRKINAMPVFAKELRIKRNSVRLHTQEILLAKDLNQLISESVIKDPFLTRVDDQQAQYILDAELLIADDVKLQLNLMEPRTGRILARTAGPIDVSSAAKAKPMVEAIASTILDQLVVTGTITDVRADQFTVNFGREYRDRLLRSKKLEVFSMLNPSNRLGEGRILEVWDELAIVAKNDIRTMVGIGDLVKHSVTSAADQPLTQLPGKDLLTVESQPPGAQVVYNGEVQSGTTPLQLNLAEDETIDLKLRHDGYLTESILLNKDDTRRPGQGSVLIRLTKDRSKLVETLITKGDFTGAEALLAEATRSDKNFFECQLRLAGLYTEHMVVPQRGLAILEKLFDQIEQLNLSTDQILLLEYNRAVVQIAATTATTPESRQDKRNMLEQTLADLKRLSTRVGVLKSSDLISHFIAFYLAETTQALAKEIGSTDSQEQARRELQNYLSRYESDQKFSAYVNKAKRTQIALSDKSPNGIVESKQ